MIHPLKLVSTSLKTHGAVQWILVTILLCLKNQNDDNTEICYMQHFCPDLPFTQVDWRSASDFDGSRTAVSLSPFSYPQARSLAAAAYRNHSKFKVFSDAQGKPRDDLFDQQRATIEYSTNYNALLLELTWLHYIWDGFYFCCPSPPPNLTN